MGFTLALPNETYCYCTLDTDCPLEEFLAYAKKEQQKAAANAGLDELSFDCAAGSGSGRQQSENYLGQIFYAGTENVDSGIAFVSSCVSGRGTFAPFFEQLDRQLNAMQVCK